MRCLFFFLLCAGRSHIDSPTDGGRYEMRDLSEAGAAKMFRLSHGALLQQGASESRLEDAQEGM